MQFKKILIFNLKKRDPVVWDNMHEPGGNYTKWNKPGTERKILHDPTYTWNLTQLDTQKQRVEWWLQGLEVGVMKRCWSNGMKFHDTRWTWSGNSVYNMVTTGKHPVSYFKFAKRVSLVFSPHTHKGNRNYMRWCLRTVGLLMSLIVMIILQWICIWNHQIVHLLIIPQ